MKKLFISYTWAAPGKYGFGNCSLEVQQEPQIPQDIEQLQLRIIEASSGYLSVSILYYRLF